MLTIFNPHTLLHYHISTFINNSKQSSIASNQAGEREKSTSLCVFSKNYFTFEPHSRLPHLSDRVALCICSILLALAGGGILALQV